MATITQTIEEFLPFTKQNTILKATMNLPKTKLEPALKTKLEPAAKTIPEVSSPTLGCPPDCECKKTKSYTPMQLFFNAIGILVALLATYFIISTDSNIYLVFWVGYSILRRLLKSRASHAKQD